MTEDYKLDKYTLHLTAPVIAVMEGYKQLTRHQHESGGILLGQVVADHIYIQKVSIPNRYDASGRLFFVRDKHAAQLIIDHEFINSGKTVTYLGEWHTHPEAIPTPSPQDMKMIKGQHALGVLHLPFVLMIIQGLTERFVGYFDGDAFVKLK